MAGRGGLSRASQALPLTSDNVRFSEAREGGRGVADDEEIFVPRVEPWTVGRLRAAIEGMPDELPVTVLVPPGQVGPGAENRAVTRAGLGPVILAPKPPGADVAEVHTVLLIECDYPRR